MNANWLLPLLLIAAGGKAAQPQPSSCGDNATRFKYIIADKALLSGGQRVREREINDTTLLRLTILLDPDAYSEDNLRTLLCLLSKRFRRPQLLLISVYTSVKQIPNPEQAEEGGLTEGPEDPNIRRYYRAYMERNKYSEFISYEDHPGGNMKTVYVKGEPQR